MENASKALLMAAGVLIGVLILSLAAYLFVYFGSTSQQIHEQNEENQINELNSKFTSYVGKDNITIYDVITVANLATENNKKYEFSTRRHAEPIIASSDYYIHVKFKNDYIEFGNEVKSKTINTDYTKKIQEEVSKIKSGSSNELNTYNCSVEINSKTGRVWKVMFKEKK